MKNKKFLIIASLLFTFLAAFSPAANASNVLLTDDQLDQIQGGSAVSFENIDKILAQLLELKLGENDLNKNLSFTNINAFNSAVVLQSNICIALNSSGNITQTNNATIINGQ